MRKTTKQLKVGDTIEVWWSPNRDTITRLTPYEGPLLNTLGDGTMIAEFAINKLGMTLGAGQVWNVICSQKVYSTKTK